MLVIRKRESSASDNKKYLKWRKKNPGTVTIKKICDGFDITLSEIFSTDEFNNLEQEIQ